MRRNDSAIIRADNARQSPSDGISHLYRRTTHTSVGGHGRGSGLLGRRGETQGSTLALRHKYSYGLRTEIFILCLELKIPNRHLEPRSSRRPLDRQ